MNIDFWKGKRVFLTGHTGFKGGWTVLWLQKLGAIIKGYSLEPNTIPSLFEIADISEGIENEFGDIRDLDRLKKSLVDFSPEIVIHMAAQPLVRLSYYDPVGTYETNVMGTVNLFEAVRACESVKAVVNVTTDKCYENNEWVWGYRENEAMGGHDPYSSSKGCSELVTSAYRRSFFGDNTKVSLGSARAGNVIGGGDWSQDRLIPDAISAFQKNKPVIIRNPLSTRPWQHVLEPISGYLMLAEKLHSTGEDYADAWNFGPKDQDVRSVGEIMDYLVAHWPAAVCWELDGSEQPHEAQLLKLDISKAEARLKWTPVWGLSMTLQSIIDWHQSWLKGSDMRRVTLGQITKYEGDLRNEHE
ncbi:CDP-glucose 4,6-dehydratase [Porticoccaceae bacterium]|nr:CDP-glucose 4,6-dehydratase [Porticoccaceae bacterium]